MKAVTGSGTSTVSVEDEETLEGVRVIRAFNRQEHEIRRFDKVNEESAEISRKSIAISGMMVPVVNSLFGLTSVGAMLAGSILVEMIFNIPGMGMLINSPIMSKDFITVQGCVVVCAVVVALANLLTDRAYAAVDPRIKAQYTAGSKKKKGPEKEASAA